MSDVQYIMISVDNHLQRLDNFLFTHLKGVPKTYIYRIIRQGEVRVNKKRAKPFQKLLEGDSVRIPPVTVSDKHTIHPSDTLKTLVKQAILYENDDFLVINKPRGLAVHGGSGIQLGLIEILRSMGANYAKAELVHRLDKETSGCVMIAKKRRVLTALHTLFVSKQINKKYLLLTDKLWKGKKTRVVNQPLLKNTLKSGERMVNISKDGKPSETYFECIEAFHAGSLIAAFPKTGRTHQIRVHAAFLGSPIIGDEKYHPEPSILAIPKRLYLHAEKISFVLLGKTYTFLAPLDDLFIEAIRLLKQGFE